MTTFRSEMGGMTPKRRRWPAVLGMALAILLVLVFVVFGRARSFDGGPPPPSLAEAERVTVQRVDGQTVPLGALIRPGLPTIINLWATWCGPCRKEMPRLAGLRRELGTGKLNMIFLNVRDEGSSAADRAAFLTGMGLAGVQSAVLKDDAIGSLTGAADHLVPRTIAFDAQGKSLGRITGYKPLAIRRIAGMLQ